MYFHIAPTTSVYFFRGYDPRIHITNLYKTTKKYTSLLTTITSNTIILRYSLRKNPTNSLLENSVLNPETNSDSPSIKSIGVRLTSQEKIKHITNTIIITFGE